MSGYQGLLWPIRPKPFGGEVLSSWVSRTAAVADVSLQEFLRQCLPKKAGYRFDLDKIEQPDFYEALAAGAGVTVEEARATSYLSDEGLVYARRTFNNLEWIAPLSVAGRRGRHYSIPFCPSCLAEDSEPFYRKRWRYAFAPLRFNWSDNLSAKADAEATGRERRLCTRSGSGRRRREIDLSSNSQWSLITVLSRVNCGPPLSRKQAVTDPSFGPDRNRGRTGRVADTLAAATEYPTRGSSIWATGTMFYLMKGKGAPHAYAHITFLRCHHGHWPRAVLGRQGSKEQDNTQARQYW